MCLPGAGAPVKLQLCVDHADGSAVLNSAEQQDWEAATAFQHEFARAALDATVVAPSDEGPVRLRVSDIDRVDLIWEA